MKKNSNPIIYLLILLVMNACSTTVSTFEAEGARNPVDLGEESAASINESESSADNNQNEPDYEIVFPQQKVNEITITISPENWQVMMDDMTDLYGEKGSGRGVSPGGNSRPGANNVNPPGAAGQAPPGGEKMQPQFGMGMMGGNDDQNPVWVEAEISFKGEIWEYVGIRFKGNSSLKSTWGSNSLKLPFKLDFDEFEGVYPETEDQRFYGFKQLSFSSGFKDDSLLREKVAADIFREAGVPSAQTAFYSVTIDYGEGPVYFGLFTAVEVVDDTVIETQFSNDNGNVYKPEGTGATFAEGSFNEDSFDKETNQDEADYSDVLALFTILHADNCLTDPETWRSELEAVFDVDTFLNWLAVNTVIQNWDTYGVMQHNYYLYNNPETSQLVWIPWDNNESLKSAGGKDSPLNLDLSRVGDNWPLISYLRDDPVYYQKYLAYLETLVEGAFELEKMVETYNYYHDLIKPYVLEEGAGFTQLRSEEVFESSVSELMNHTRDRVLVTKKLLSNN